ncbi:MAG: hypothetical protein PWP24_1331 [Clostridiales bacterium]|nr:hypothetical protein [Clostridiales bacterium]
MTKLANIIQRIEADFEIHIHGFKSGDISIESCQFLTKEISDTLDLDPLTLYLGNYPDLCKLSLDGNVLLLNSKRREGQERGLYIYQALDPLLVFNCIQQELYKNMQANLKKEEMFHAIQANYGIQSILDIARTYLNNTITVCTTSFSVLCVSPRNEYDNKFDEYNKKHYLKKSLLHNMKKNNVMAHILTSKKPLTISFEDEDQVRYLFCGIHIKHAAVGYVCLRSSLRPFEEEDFSFVVELCAMLSVEMQKDEFYSERVGLQYEYFLTDLLEQNVTNSAFAKERLTLLGQTFYRYFWVLSFSFSGKSNNRMNPNYYIDQLLGLFRHSMAIYHKGKFVLLVSSMDAMQKNKWTTEKFYHFLELNQMHAYISLRFENLMDTHLYYKQVLFLMEHAHKKSSNRCFFYEDYDLEALFHAANESLPLETLLHPDISFLLGYDKEHHTDYIATLNAFFSCNRNAVLASRALHIHKSTLFYRLGKISDLTSFSMEQANLLFSYELSFHLLAYQKKEGNL